MSEPLPPPTTSEPVGPTPEIGRKNLVLGLGLLAVVLLMAAGAVVVTLIYLQFD